MAVSFIPIFETKSNRVKGVAFHPTRTWVLASLHNGVIQLWDYRIRTLVDRFGEHDGPVRAVDFHQSQPLFVSGGDDYKIKVWNYKERRCSFTLLGHLDYIRSVEFHHEYPWILSASDDQTIRIWNWQSRQCLAVLTGHSHYVMCARFHPTEDLVVSASLDMTVRVWDISGLRKKNIAPMSHRDESNSRQPELFGNTDAMVKFVLEGHDRGVNWASFHPTSPFIISGADDRQIKLWRMNDTKAWEVDTLRGHYNNVCSCLFHPREDLMISNSEDKTIRVWDMAKRTAIYTYRRDHDRFWALDAHPRLNLFIAGHDSGFVVFKLCHERPPYHAFRSSVLFYIKDKYLKSYHFESERDTSILSLRKTSGNVYPRSLVYNNRENVVLISYTGEGGDRYEIFVLPKDGRPAENVTPRGGSGRAALWINRNRFAVLDKSNVIFIKDINNETKKKITPPHSIDYMFAAGPDLLLLRADDRITLYDTVQERTTGFEAKIPFVKDAVWNFKEDGKEKTDKNSSGTLVAFICRTGVVVATPKLEVMFTIPETMKVKSGVWDENGTFIYSTLSHIKYALPSGDHGIVRTLDRPIYITAAKGNKVFCMDRQGKNRAVTIDTTEYTFKHALANKRFDEVLRMVKNSNLIGQAIIGYLQKNGYPEVALHFVKDEKTRFNLALECSNYMHNIDIALQSAKILDDKDSWTKLGQEALRQGNHQIVEKAYQQTLDFERLSFFYLICGNTKNLRRMEDIAIHKRKDVNARYYNALLLGNVQSRVQLLEEQGQYQLAYITAISHGLEDMAKSIREKLQYEHEKEYANTEEEIPPLILPTAHPAARLLFPPIPILHLDKSNWPMTRVSRGPFDMVMASAGGAAPSLEQKVAAAANVDDDLGEPQGTWGEELALDDDGEGELKLDDTVVDDTPTEPNAWGDVGDDIPDLDLEDTGHAPAVARKFVTSLPPPGQSKEDYWSRSSALAADSVAAGRFEDAMRLLNQQIGIINFAPLKPHFLRIRQSASAQLIGLAGLSSLPIHLERPLAEGQSLPEGSPGLPRIVLTLQAQIDHLTAAYRAMTGGKFIEAKDLFLSILHSLPLVVVQTRAEANEVKEFVQICREYLLGIATELARKEASTGQKEQNRHLELAAYFTHCDLQVKHLQLSLKSAMNAHARVLNYATAAEFARKLLDTSPSADVVAHTQKVLQLCERKGRTDVIPLNYDPRNPFILCAASLTPIYQGSPNIRCPYCSASYKPEFSGKLCNLCELAEIGKNSGGLVSLEVGGRRKK